MKRITNTLTLSLSLSVSLLFPGLAQSQTCSSAGLKLPPGFCATVFADSVRGARHLTVAPNGDVFIAQANGRAGKGGVVALRDTTHDGVADMRVKFGANGGSGIALRGENLYLATNDAVLRYMLPKGNLLAHDMVDTIVKGLPAGTGHTAKTIALGAGNVLYVNIGSATNSCQSKDRAPNIPGVDPCTELETRAGIWRFDATRKDQTQADGKRYATGLRNVVALNTTADGTVYGLQMGRDQLGDWTGFTKEDNAEKPAEIFVRIDANDDYGWPYCYYDLALKQHVLSPEYGGDGKQQGRCARIEQPLAAYPGHWAPEAHAFYRGTMFPAQFREGAFISFHGSWNRAPLPQAGYKVVFQPMKNGKASGDYVTFADNFLGPNDNPPGQSSHRPMGIAVGPDGALYIGDDAGGRIYRVTYRSK